MFEVIHHVKVFEKRLADDHKLVTLPTQLILVDSELALAFSLEKIETWWNFEHLTA